MFLEGLRGFAAFMVVIQHYIGGWYTSDEIISKEVPSIMRILMKSPLSLLWNGNLAVCIFFVLSGYVLSYKFFKTNDKQVVISGIIRRYWRLALPAVASIILALILLSSGFFYNHEAARITSSSFLDTYWSYDANVLGALIQGFYTTFFAYDKTFDAASYNSVLWTMHIELYGSFIVFGSLLLCGNYSKRWLFSILSLIIFSKSPYSIGFLVGMFICDIHNQNSKRLIPIPVNLNEYTAFFILIFSLFLEYSTSFAIKWMNPNLLNYFHICAASLLVFSIFELCHIQKILENKFFSFLGKISFSLYLVHFPILGSLASYIFLTMIKNQFSYNISFFFSFIISLSITFLVSYFFYEYIDQKTIHFTKFFEKVLKKIFDKMKIILFSKYSKLKT